MARKEQPIDALAAAGDPELRRALLHARSSPRPVTADELAESLGVHRNVARARLERLVRAGLLEPGFERRSGRAGPGGGRPAKTYRVAPELAAIEFPARRYEPLLALLLQALGDAAPERLREVGAAFGGELAAAGGVTTAAALPAAADAVCAALGRLGYQASVVEAGADEALLRTPTCPLRPLVVARPEAVELDRGLWAGLLAAALPGAAAERVECHNDGCLDAHADCRVRVRVVGVTPHRP